MDTKSMAKSKRAHSLHHSKKHNPHHHQASKAPSVGGDKMPIRGKIPSQSHVSSTKLPSNSDRYGEELDFDSENAARDQPAEFVLPKSKGGDYAHLISEARESQSHAFPVFSHDYTQDFGPLLSEKGQTILSWIADNNFEFEDKASTNFEAPFLSLNLNALAEQLSKVKLTKRLFIEPDLLPPELLDDELQLHGENKIDAPTCTSAVAIDAGASSVDYNQESNNNFQQYQNPISSAQGMNPVEQINDDIFFHSQQTDKIPSLNLTSAEEELDMLLNSFSETNIVESSIKTPSIADDIDNLLEEKSDITNMGVKGESINASTDDKSSTLNPGSKSKLLDDFDSWLDTI